MKFLAWSSKHSDPRHFINSINVTFFFITFIPKAKIKMIKKTHVILDQSLISVLGLKNTKDIHLHKNTFGGSL